MIRMMMAAAAFLLAAGPLTPAAAQQLTPEQAAPAIKLVHPGAKYFYVDLNYVLGLTSEEEQEQLPLLKKYGFDPFLVGVDHDRLLRIDALTGKDEIRYLWYVPLADLSAFRRDNMEAAGIESKKIGATLYRLQDDFGVLGFMQVKNDYALIGPNRADVIRNPVNAKAGAEELVKQHDFTFEILNEQTAPAAIDVRTKQFESKIRKELFASVEQTETEPDDQFAFRQLFTGIQLDELGRLYSSARLARLGLTIDGTKQVVSRLEMTIDPLPDTNLAASFQLLGQKPSAFANVPRTENTVLSARINHPLDEMRQKNFVRLSQFLRKQTKEEYDAETKGTAGEKADRKKAVDLFFDMIDAGLKSGVLDAFVEAHPAAGGKHTVVGGILAVDGTAIIEPLELFPRKSQGQSVELNVAEAGDVKIHKFTAATKDHPLFNDFLGSDVVYIGSSPTAVWYAGGANALEELQAAITSTTQPNSGKAGDPLADIIVRLGTWMKLRQAMQAGQPADENVLTWRRLAVEAFAAGDDRLTIVLNRAGNRVEGTMTGQPGIMRFVGKVMADFSKENFED